MSSLVLFKTDILTCANNTIYENIHAVVGKQENKHIQPLKKITNLLKNKSINIILCR